MPEIDQWAITQFIIGFTSPKPCAISQTVATASRTIAVNIRSTLRLNELSNGFPEQIDTGLHLLVGNIERWAEADAVFTTS